METIKQEVQKKYGEIARSNGEQGCCADALCCSPEVFNDMATKYPGQQGYVAEADLGLGCGIPTDGAGIEPGHTVVDLGSGAGNDVFIARSLVGETGRVIGVDFTPEMVIQAWRNNHLLGYTNVEFHLSDIEDMKPIESDVADVVVSNCVLNLVPDKEKAFGEIHRILKEGGHFSVSDIIYKGDLPEGVLTSAEMHVGCVAGASERGNYLGVVKQAGFKDITVLRETKVTLPDEVLLNYMTQPELEAFKQGDSGLYSITVQATKSETGSCCEPSGSECCSPAVTATEQTTSSNCC